MKNKKLLKTLSILALSAAMVVVAAQSGICEPDAVQNAAPVVAESVEQATKSVNNDVIIKFAVAMLGVVVSAVILFLGLWIYNKFFVDKRLFPNNNGDDVVNTPKTVNEAVIGFIKRNKL